MNVQGGMGQMQINMGPGGMPQGVGVGMQTGMPGPGIQGPIGGMQVMSGGMQGAPGNVMQGPVVMGGQPGIMHASPQNPNTPGQMMQVAQQQQQQPQEKLDNISKVKSLIGPLRESLNATFKAAGQSLQQNNLIDAGTMKCVDPVAPRFDKHLEEFFSICDQIELHLKTAAECINQAGSSSRYLPVHVALTRTEPIGAPDTGTLTYPQYLSTARSQVMFAKEVHDSLSATAQNLTPNE